MADVTPAEPKVMDAEYKDLVSSTAYTPAVDNASLASDRAQSIRDFGYQEETSGGAGDWFSNLITTDYFWNYNREPAPSFNFFLRIEAAFDAPCRSVRAFSKENEFEEIQEGGRNDYVILKRKPNARRFTLQVERYVGIDKVDPLQLGTEMVLPMLLAVSRVSSSSSGFADTMVQTEFIRFYAFTGCIVTGKEYGELNAEQSGLLREVTTIAYREMVAITTPNADMTKTPWDIKNWDKTRSDKNARANDPFPEWNEARAETRNWNIRNHKSTKDDPATDMRSAARPVADPKRAEVKSWQVTEAKSKSSEANRSAKISETDTVRAEVFSFDIKDPKGARAAAAPAEDRKKAKKVLFNIRAKSKNRSAEAPKDDEKRARIKAYTVTRRKTNRSATLPEKDSVKAQRMTYSIKKKGSNTSALVPAQDIERAEVDGFDVTNGASKYAAVPAEDKSRADVAGFSIEDPKGSRSAAVPAEDERTASADGYKISKNSKPHSATVPAEDRQTASVKSFKIEKVSRPSSAIVPTDDRKTADVKSFRIAKRSRPSSATVPTEDRRKPRVDGFKITRKSAPHSATVPEHDKVRAERKMWDIRKPGMNRSAVIVKGASDVANFLSGGKR